MIAILNFPVSISTVEWRILIMHYEAPRHPVSPSECQDASVPPCTRPSVASPALRICSSSSTPTPPAYSLFSPRCIHVYTDFTFLLFFANPG